VLVVLLVLLPHLLRLRRQRGALLRREDVVHRNDLRTTTLAMSWMSCACWLAIA